MRLFLPLSPLETLSRAFQNDVYSHFRIRKYSGQYGKVTRTFRVAPENYIRELLSGCFEMFSK